jgi:hypothetical protein
MQDHAVAEDAVFPHDGVCVEQTPLADRGVFSKVAAGANDGPFAHRDPGLDHRLGLHAGTGRNLGG